MKPGRLFYVSIMFYTAVEQGIVWNTSELISMNKKLTEHVKEIRHFPRKPMDVRL